MRCNQILAGVLRDYGNVVTGRRYMETHGEGFLNLVRTSLELSGRPELINLGHAVRLTIFAAQGDDRSSS